MEQHEMIEKFENWINQRPGLDWYNYGDSSLIKQEYRHIAKQKDRANFALSLVSRLPFDETIFKKSMRSAFSGRLQFNENNDLEYTTGQYWPTEYRLAAAVVLEQYIFDICYTDPDSAAKVLNILGSSKYSSKRWAEEYDRFAQEIAPLLDRIDTEKITDVWISKRNKALDNVERFARANNRVYSDMLESALHNYIRKYRTNKG